MGPIRIVRHASYQKRLFDVIPAWVGNNLPQLSELLSIRELPCELGAGARVLVPWLQDPVQAWSRETYDQVMALQTECDAAGIPVVNRVDRLANAGKARGSELAASVGLRAPRMSLITDPAAFRRDFGGLAFPLFVREDWEHGSVIHQADTPDAARRVPLERYKRPVAVERIDVRDPRDGFFHKYRYFACGDTGVSGHVQVSQSWITRGDKRISNEATQAEELAYVERPDPFHARFQALRNAMGLDMIAVDYGLDAQDEPVVWEANPYPHIQFGTYTAYRNRAVHRTVAAVVRLYLRSAGLAVPPELDAVVAY